MPSNGVSAAEPTVKLRGLDFPATKQDLIKQARDNKADEKVLRMLRLSIA